MIWYAKVLMIIHTDLPISYIVESWLHKRQKQTSYNEQNFNKKKWDSPWHLELWSNIYKSICTQYNLPFHLSFLKPLQIW